MSRRTQSFAGPSRRIQSLAGPRGLSGAARFAVFARSISLVAGLALGFGAQAAPVTEDLDAVGRTTDAIETSLGKLSESVIPAGPEVTRRDAVVRYQDYVYLHLIGQDKEAAEGFYGLVTTGALEDPTLHRDAAWQLAEALNNIGNVDTAETSFRAVIDDPNQPFRRDAVLHLLDLYARQGDFEAFNQLYEAEIVTGKVPATPQISYSVGKSFYRQGDNAKAKSFFVQVLADSEYYSRSQYFLGVIAIREQQVAAAEPYFLAAVGAPFTDSVTRDANDLARLAIARLAYESGDFRKAADNYAQIGGDSAYLADILYETVWSFIKQDRYDEGLKSIDLFLLAFPEHRYNGELRVVQGHLYMGCAQTPAKCPRPPLYVGGDAYDQALSTYEQIVLDYEPIRAQFDELGSATGDPRAYFQRVLTQDASDADAEISAGSESRIPSFAVAMMQADPSLAKTLEVYASLEEQKRDLAESEQMIAEIDAVLSQESGLGAVGRLEVEALGAQSSALLQQVTLLETEARWLREAGARGVAAAQPDVAALASVRAAAAARVDVASAIDGRVAEVGGRMATQRAKVDVAEEALGAIVLRFDPTLSEEATKALDVEMVAASEALEREQQVLRSMQVELTRAQVPGPELTAVAPPASIGALRTRLQALRPASQAAMGARFDDLHARLDRAHGKAAEVLARIDAFGQTEYGRIQDRFQAEVVQVAAQRAELDRVNAESDTVSVDVTRAGLGRMEAFFADSVLKAEMGVIDVYWARKLELADERERLQTERNNLVAELERRFQLIRQKMEQ